METIQESIKKMKELEKNISEQRVGAQTVKDFKSALGELKDVKVNFNLKMTESKILSLIELDAKNFAKEVEKAARKDLKNGTQPGMIGPELKELSKLDAIRRITDETSRLNRKLTPSEIDAIKNRTKIDSIEVTNNIKIKPKATGAGTPPPGTPPPGTGTTSKTSKVVEAIKKLPKNIKDGIINLVRAKRGWRVIAKYVLLAGVPLSVAWYFLKDSGEELTTDFPNNVPQDFPPCVQDLIKNKQGELLTESNGNVVIVVKNNEYPNGIQFYPNGRVLDIKTGKKGSYKCKGEKVSLNEQSEEEMAKDVDVMIDLLDFPVSQNDMLKASSMLEKYKNSGKGREFLTLYQQSGLGGGSLKKSLDYLYTTDARSVQIKNKLYTLVNQIESGVSSGGTTKTSSGDLSGIDITWDTKTSTGGGGSTGSGTGNVRYKDKSDFPFPRGTRNEKIRDIQKSLGFPQKYQTGNFGPMTYKGLVSFIQNPESYKYGLTGGWSAYIEELKTIGLTKDLYDIIMRFGKKIEVPVGGQTTSGETQTQGQTIGGETSPVDTQTTGSDVTTKTTSPDRTPATTDETPSQLFNRFVKEGAIKGRLNGARIVYKGGDLTDGDREKLISQLNSMGFRVSRENLDYRKGDKIVFKKNETEE